LKNKLHQQHKTHNTKHTTHPPFENNGSKTRIWRLLVVVLCQQRGDDSPVWNKRRSRRFLWHVSGHVSFMVKNEKYHPFL
jgi:hypothetical protein